MEYQSNFHIALNLFKQRKFDDAATILKKTIKLNPNDNNVINLLGLVCFEQGNFQQGVAYLEKLILNRNDCSVTCQ